MAENNEGYCIKCKAVKEMANPTTITIRGRQARVGDCPTCGQRMMRMLVQEVTSE